jgi:hypothetical protein
MTRAQTMAGHGAQSRNNGGNAVTIPLIAGGFFRGLHAYREMVDVEVRRASEHGARWWSRRLVEMCEEAGLLHLDK